MYQIRLSMKTISVLLAAVMCCAMAYATENVLSISSVKQINRGEIQLALELQMERPLSEKIGDNQVSLMLDNKPVELTSFQLSPIHAPEVIVALDTSGSMKRRLAQAKRIAKDFIEALPSGTMVTIAGFNDEPRFYCERIIVPSEAFDCLKKLRSGGRFTALYDTLEKSFAKLEQRSAPSKLILLFTDGRDENSVTSFKDIIRRLENSSVSLFILGLGRKVPEDKMRRFADKGNGVYFRCTGVSKERLQKLLSKVNKAVQRSHYKGILTFRIPQGMSLTHRSNVTLSLEADNRALRSTIALDEAGLSTLTSLQTSDSSEVNKPSSALPAMPNPTASGKHGNKKNTLIVVVLLVLGLIVAFIYWAKRKKREKRICPRCGEEIPEFMDNCIACVDIAEQRTTKRDGRKAAGSYKKSLIDTEPLLAFSEEQLDHTLILTESPVLVHMLGQRGIETYNLTGIDSIYLGRNDTCDVVVKDTSVSSRHAVIRRQSEDFFIRDLGSTNGTFLNERRVSGEEQKINYGDQIRIGQSRFIFKLEQRRPR